jgi:hypothetical protein
MVPMRAPHLLVFAALTTLAACGEPVRDDHYSNGAAPQERAALPPVEQRQAVRVGELGPNFDACAGAGTTRNLVAGKTLPVRAAPFESAQETGAITSGARFFICNRSHDQKWLGVVFQENGALAETCGVSSPITQRRAYDGPCRSGWVAAAFVRLVAGVEQPPATPNQTPAGGTTGG